VLHLESAVRCDFLLDKWADLTVAGNSFYAKRTVSYLDAARLTVCIRGLERRGLGQTLTDDAPYRVLISMCVRRWRTVHTQLTRTLATSSPAKNGANFCGGGSSGGGVADITMLLRWLWRRPCRWNWHSTQPICVRAAWFARRILLTRIVRRCVASVDASADVMFATCGNENRSCWMWNSTQFSLRNLQRAHRQCFFDTEKNTGRF